MTSSSTGRTLTAVFFSATTYFVHFIALGFSSFPLQTHLRTQLTPATASVLAALIPIAACATYFVFRFAESRQWTRHPQKVLLVASIGVAVMQALLGYRLNSLAQGNSWFGPVVDVALSLLLLGCAQSSVMTMLNHIGVATMGALAYTVRAAGSAGYMCALMIMGWLGGESFNVESNHLYVGSVISIAHCLLVLAACFMIPIEPHVAPVPSTNALDREDGSRGDPASAGGRFEWYSLLALVWLVALCEMAYGLYSHEFLTKTFGAMGYFVFAAAVAIEIALLVAMPMFPKFKSKLLFVGPLGWTILFTGCVATLTGIPAFGLAGLALALNCPFQISANEHAHRLRPSVMGVASLTLAQSLGYVTAAGLSSGISNWVSWMEIQPVGGIFPMPVIFWVLMIPLSLVALGIAIRKVVVNSKSVPRESALSEPSSNIALSNGDCNITSHANVSELENAAKLSSSELATSA